MTVYQDPSLPAIFTQAPENPKVANLADILRTQKDLITVLGEWADNLKAILEGGISFVDNMDVAFVTFTSNGTPDTEDTVAHTLGKVPSYMATVSLDKGAVVYKGGTAWTSSNIYVKTNTASTAVVLMIF